MAHSWMRFSTADQAGETEVCLLYITAILHVLSISSDVLNFENNKIILLSHLSNNSVHKHKSTLTHQECITITFTPCKCVSES